MLDTGAFCSVDESAMTFVVNGLTRFRASSENGMSREYYSARATQREVERFGISQVSTNRLRTQ